MKHEVRLNKRPITAKPYEKFGKFTQNLFAINNTNEMMTDRSCSPTKLANLL